MKLESKIKIGITLVIAAFLLKACWADKQLKDEKVEFEKFCLQHNYYIVNSEPEGKATRYYLNVDSKEIDNKIKLESFLLKWSEYNCKDYCIIHPVNRDYSSREDSAVGMFLSIDNTMIWYTDKIKLPAMPPTPLK